MEEDKNHTMEFENDPLLDQGLVFGEDFLLADNTSRLKQELFWEIQKYHNRVQSILDAIVRPFDALRQELTEIFDGDGDEEELTTFEDSFERTSGNIYDIGTIRRLRRAVKDACLNEDVRKSQACYFTAKILGVINFYKQFLEADRTQDLVLNEMCKLYTETFIICMRICGDVHLRAYHELMNLFAEEVFRDEE